MNKTYIGYARVSTEEQNEARQLHSFEGYTEKIKKVFIDKLSGKNTDRPQLQAMLSYVREGDVVVVSDFSRLARSTRDMLQIVQELTDKVTELVSKLPPVVLHDVITEDEKVYKFEKEEQFAIERDDSGTFVITGVWAKMTMGSTNFDNYDSIQYFQRSMINAGVIDALKAAGIKEGDTVRIEDLEFEYIE